MKLRLKRGGGLLAFSLLAAALFLGICSKSSPLYPMNDWVDVNCFFTVGRSILHGLVPYADLYEQKGPVLYFLYALAALVSEHSFFGVYLLETVTFGLFLYWSGKLARLYLGDSKMVYFLVAVLAAVIPVSRAFAHGGSCEETSLFLLIYGLYSVTAALRENRLLTFREAFLNGIFAAMALYIKFTMMGFYLGLALFVIIWYLSTGFRWKELLRTVGQFLLGMAAVSALVFVYFGIHGAVSDFLRVYFYNNLFLYPQETEGTRLALIFNCLKSTLQYNFVYAWLIYGGVVLILLELRKNWREPLMTVLCFAGLTAGTYWGGRGYIYYGLILAVFAVYGLIAIGKYLRYWKLPLGLKRVYGTSPVIFAVALSLFTAGLLAISYKSSGNTYLMDYEKEDLPPYRFAQTISQAEDAKILNFGFLDGGFYYAADVLPNCEFFCTLNINAPDMWQIQRECIENGEVDFVITRKYTLDRYIAGAGGFTLVDEATFRFEGVDFTYYLYQKNPNA
ncbi:MAG: hypothetical protein PUB93_04120 [Firmicutes bacterium]|nr:hypothetical protein [Bacillota bacterium]